MRPPPQMKGREMQELLGRLGALDSEVGQGLRVIACFDELIVGNVNTRALLSAAAALAGCAVGFRQMVPSRQMRVDPRGGLLPDAAPPGTGVVEADGQAVWLEREGPAAANDGIILERLAMALRVRHGRSRAELDRRDMVVLLDGTTPTDVRRQAAGRLGLRVDARYRVVVAPLFANWRHHPVAPEDVVPSSYGPLHVLVVPADDEGCAAQPSGTGLAGCPDDLSRSYRTAVVALLLWDDSCTRTSEADRFGGVLEMLLELAEESTLPDVERVAEIAAYPWGPATLEAVVQSGSVRHASRLVDVHHSTMQSRIDTLVDRLGFDPLEGYGRARLGVAWLVWRLRNSRVLELPTPAPATAPPAGH